MSKHDILGLSGAAVLDRRETPSPELRRPLTAPLQARRELPNDFAEDEDTAAFLRRTGRRHRIRRGLIPQSRRGRIVAGISAALLLALAAFCGNAVRNFLTTDPRFRIPSATALELEGNTHLSRAQMLAVMAADIDRNIFRVPLAVRQSELEAIPWVEHATIMRLLPNRLRIHVSERTPVAFTREGGTIGMADANGVLLSIPADAPGNLNYSFPVVTGLHSADTLASRRQRMRLYTALLRDLDSTGTKISTELSEVDLSDPEDVKVLIPDHNSEVLVHLGADNFLSRYKRFKEHIDEWRGQYPHLSSVDMRYERQVVLQMPPHDAASSVPDGAAASSPRTMGAHPSVPTSRTVAAPHAVTASDGPHSAGREAQRPSEKAPRFAVHQSAETARKVEAIKAWMARREKERGAAKEKSPASAPN